MSKSGSPLREVIPIEGITRVLLVVLGSVSIP